MLDAGDAGPQQAAALFDVAPGQLLRFTKSEAVAEEHGQLALG